MDIGKREKLLDFMTQGEWASWSPNAAQAIREVRQELVDIRAELKKYLVMNDEETIIGGIRNLAQVAMLQNIESESHS